jgi:hypothetical protein
MPPFDNRNDDFLMTYLLQNQEPRTTGTTHVEQLASCAKYFKKWKPRRWLTSTAGNSLMAARLDAFCRLI